jgi:hypothetical protein
MGRGRSARLRKDGIAYGGERMRLTPEQADLLRRRTMPFLDSVGMGKPVSHLLQEAYVQGLRDAMDALSPALQDQQ